jgi:hypothetical protein
MAVDIPAAVVLDLQWFRVVSALSTAWLPQGCSEETQQLSRRRQ